MAHSWSYLSAARLVALVLGFTALALTGVHAQEKTVIAVVGGTSFGYPPDFAKGLASDEGSFTVETDVGESPPIFRMRYKDVPFYYIQAHGRSPKKDSKITAPSGDEYVKTWVALHQLGVQYALGGATAGAINPDYDFDDFVIADDFILIGNQRPQSVLAAGGIVRDNRFDSFAVPFCPDLRRLLIDESRKSYQGRVHPSGVIVQDDPMRFETPAEIRMMRGLGGDMVTHNVVTEAVYARQLGIHFAVLNSVSNPATGLKPYTYEDMQDSVTRIAAGAVPVVLEVIARIPKLEHTCGYGCIGEPFEGSYTNKQKKLSSDP
jgi:5'-methylthioadenosine phosphorylase